MTRLLEIVLSISMVYCTYINVGFRERSPNQDLIEGGPWFVTIW